MKGEQMTEETPARFVFWCKTKTGIVEHETSPYEGHRGHVRCVPVEQVSEGY